MVIAHRQRWKRQRRRCANADTMVDMLIGLSASAYNTAFNTDWPRIYKCGPMHFAYRIRNRINLDGIGVNGKWGSNMNPIRKFFIYFRWIPFTVRRFSIPFIRFNTRHFTSNVLKNATYDCQSCLISSFLHVTIAQNKPLRFLITSLNMSGASLFHIIFWLLLWLLIQSFFSFIF